MNCRPASYLFVSSLAFVAGTLAETSVAQSRGEAAPRARLPVFSEEEISGIFFKDVFSHLQGERPGRSSTAPSPAGETGTVDGPETAETKRSWPQIVSATTIADEVKAIKIRADRAFRSPSNLAGGGAKSALRDMATLAMLFGIVVEFEGDVRFRASAEIARDRFAESAELLTDLSGAQFAAAFRNIQARKQDLQALLSGSELIAEPGRTEVDWGRLSQRPPLMQRLEIGVRERLLGWTGAAETIQRRGDEIVREAEITAAIAAVLTDARAPDADDSEYVSLMREMGRAASAVAAAVRSDEPQLATQAALRLDQSCNRCHEDYR